MHKNLLNLLAFMVMFCFSATCSAFTETLREVSATMEIPNCYDKVMEGRYEHPQAYGHVSVLTAFPIGWSGLMSFDRFCEAATINAELENNGITPAFKYKSYTSDGYEVFRIMYTFRRLPDRYHPSPRDCFIGKAVINFGDDYGIIIAHSGLIEDAIYFNDIIDSFRKPKYSERVYEGYNGSFTEMPAKEVLSMYQGKWQSPEGKVSFEVYGDTIRDQGNSEFVKVRLEGKGTISCGEGNFEFVNPPSGYSYSLSGIFRLYWNNGTLEAYYYDGRGPHTMIRNRLIKVQ